MRELPSYKSIWTITFPIILSLLAQNIIAVINTIFLSAVDIVSFDASAIGGIYYHVLYMVGFGFTTGTQILISRRNGERRYSRIGVLMENCWYFLFLGALLLIPLSKLITPIIMQQMVGSQAVLKATVEYIDYRIFGLFFAYVVASFRAFHVGTTKSSVLMYSGAIMAGVNIILDYLLIFGSCGFPKMGLHGAAIASIAAEFSAALFLVIYNYNRRNKTIYKLFAFRKVNFKLIRDMLNLSVYIMLLYFISVAIWLGFFIVVERSGDIVGQPEVGERNLAISNIIRSLYSIMGLPIWALAATVNSLVSNAIGARKMNLVVPIMKRVGRIAFIVSGSISLIAVTCGQWLLIPYTINDPSLIQASLPSLYVLAVANLIFGLSTVVFNSITGIGKTKVAMVIELLALTVYIAAAIFFVKISPLHIEVAWISEIVYWLLIGIFSLLYIKLGNWRSIKL